MTVLIGYDIMQTARSMEGGRKHRHITPSSRSCNGHFCTTTITAVHTAWRRRVFPRVEACRVVSATAFTLRTGISASSHTSKYYYPFFHTIPYTKMSILERPKCTSYLLTSLACVLAPTAHNLPWMGAKRARNIPSSRNISSLRNITCFKILAEHRLGSYKHRQFVPTVFLSVFYVENFGWWKILGRPVSSFRIRTSIFGKIGNLPIGCG